MCAPEIQSSDFLAVQQQGGAEFGVRALDVSHTLIN
jgi:hypothetical protein